jgi:hypothetical protein
MDPYRHRVVATPVMGARARNMLDRAPVWVALCLAVGRSAQAVITGEEWGPAPTLAAIGVVICLIELVRLHRATS